MRRASLVAGAGILLVGIGALALVRPWGLRVPRWLLLVPAITGSAYAMAHALTAYVTKPLHALGIRQDGRELLVVRFTRALKPAPEDVDGRADDLLARHVRVIAPPHREPCQP